MKTSFYFVAWILVYVLIDILNIQLLKENSFVAACVIVWGGAYIMNKVFATNVQNQQVRKAAKFFEKIYTDDVNGLRKEIFKDLILEVICAVYLLLIIIGLASLSTGEFVVYVVFGFFFLLSCKNSYKLLVKYNSIKNVGSLSEFTEDSITNFLTEEEIDCYNSYCTERNEHSFDEMCPPKERSYKIYQITSVVLSIVCILLGVVLLVSWLPLFFFANQGGFLITAMVLYASMALFYGIKDLINCLKKN